MRASWALAASFYEGQGIFGRCGFKSVGMKATDRFTLQSRTATALPIELYVLTAGRLVGA